MANRGAAHEVLPPSGTVTFLFSDIEGSTRRWDRHRAAMQEAVRLHDGLMRDAIATHGGYVFKTVGDAFCAAFARPEAAVAAALAAQLELGAADFSAVDGLRVRMAVNTGTTDERDGDYFGPAVNRVARLLAICHGGQVLLSAARPSARSARTRSRTSNGRKPCTSSSRPGCAATSRRFVRIRRTPTTCRPKRRRS
jgi:class 3 adenylate cyclase